MHANRNDDLSVGKLSSTLYRYTMKTHGTIYIYKTVAPEMKIYGCSRNFSSNSYMKILIPRQFHYILLDANIIVIEAAVFNMYNGM